MTKHAEEPGDSRQRCLRDKARSAACRGADAAPGREPARPFPPTRTAPTQRARPALRQSKPTLADRLPPVESAIFHRQSGSGVAI